MAFCTALDMITAIDNNWLFQFINDDNTMCTSAQFQASPRTLAAIGSASGRIQAKAFQGGRYTLADLQTLTGDNLALLVWINVHIAAGHLAFSRQMPAEEVARTLPAYGESLAFLQELQDGHVIFNIPSLADVMAGLPTLQRQCSGIVTRSVRYFGRIANPSPCCPTPDPCDPPGNSSGGCC